MNLADNAVRHTRERDSIWLGSSLVGELARLWVRDEGPGIEAGRPRANLRPLRARRRRAPRGASDGAGLGLSIVRAIADAHGGQVELDSLLGARIDVHDRPPRDPPERMSRILIAEDETRLASFLEKGLRASGFTTTVVGGRDRGRRWSRTTTTSTC